MAIFSVWQVAWILFRITCKITEIVTLSGLSPRAQATAAACELFTQAAMRVLMDASYPARMIPAAILPFFAIDFSDESGNLVVSYKLTRFANRLRGSLLDRLLLRDGGTY